MDREVWYCFSDDCFGIPRFPKANYRKGVISDHKIGSSQLITIFIYGDIFDVLEKFVNNILQKIPAFTKCEHKFCRNMNLFNYYIRGHK